MNGLLPRRNDMQLSDYVKGARCGKSEVEKSTGLDRV